MTRPITSLAAYVEFAGALPVPFGHARPLAPAPPIEAADVPLADLLDPDTTTPEEGIR